MTWMSTSSVSLSMAPLAAFLPCSRMKALSRRECRCWRRCRSTGAAAEAGGATKAGAAGAACEPSRVAATAAEASGAGASDGLDTALRGLAARGVTRMLAGYRPLCRGVVCGRRGAPRSGMAWQDASDSGASVCPLVSIARARSAQRDRVFGFRLVLS